MAILIPLRQKYLTGQYKGIQRKKGDNQPGKVFKDPQGKMHVVPRQSGKSGLRAQQPVGYPQGQHNSKNPRECNCGGCGPKRRNAAA